MEGTIIGFQMTRAAAARVLTQFPCGRVVTLISAEQDMEVLLMRGDETRSYHTIDQRPWDLQSYRLDEQPDLKVRPKRERLSLQDIELWCWFARNMQISTALLSTTDCWRLFVARALEDIVYG